MKSLGILAFSFLLTGSSIAQLEEINGGPVNVPADGIVDGVYIAEHIPTKRLIPYEYVREADVIWSRRVWQSIDLREKINHNLYLPLDDYAMNGKWIKNATRWSLWTVLKTHVLNGDLRVFSPYNPDYFQLRDGDQLKYPIDPQPGMNYYTDSIYRNNIFNFFGKEKAAQEAIKNVDGEDSVTYNADGSYTPVYPPSDTVWIKSQDIVKYHVKEDWFFDKERSVLDVRIIAVAPVIYKKDDSGQISGLEELFWLYFPHCRFVLNNYFVYNDQNDAQWMSFDDLFWKRRFNSIVIKESNTFDRAIESYRMGADALLESDKIKEEIRTIEHDVWNF